jgi:hypothetical protein
MANTIDWGKATQNNTNGFGKYKNTIGAASVYAVSYAGETVIEGTSAAFSYSKSSFHQDESDPTPTITGTAGGTFSATPSGLSINTSTGTIDLDNSTIQPYTITYTVDGVSANFSLSVTASPFLANTYSMEFDGSSSYIYGPLLGDLIDLDPATSTFTISCWIYAPSTGYRGICASANFTNGLQLYINGSNLYFGISSGTSQINAGVTYAAGWHHVAASFNGPEFGGTTLRLYFDGAEIATGTGNRSGYSFNGNINLDIGARNGGSGTPNNFWLGNIDEFAIWNTALGETAIQEIYNATANNTNKVLDLNTDTGNYTSSSNLQYWNRLGD